MIVWCLENLGKWSVSQVEHAREKKPACIHFCMQHMLTCFTDIHNQNDFLYSFHYTITFDLIRWNPCFCTIQEFIFIGCVHSGC